MSANNRPDAPESSRPRVNEYNKLLGISDDFPASGRFWEDTLLWGVIFVFFACSYASSARADDALHHHVYTTGETIRYDFEDTDTTFLTAMKDGTIQASDPIKVQEIQIPVSIDVSSGTDGGLTRQLTISSSARYRASAPNQLSATPFQPAITLYEGPSAPFSYLYANDTDALDHLENTFESVRQSRAGDFLFYKMEDVHQMQESTANIPDGIVPGHTHFSPGHERKGLGGHFVAASSHLIYESTETFNGIKAGYFKVVTMGHELTLRSLKAYTNFFFTMHVALEGPAQGTLLFGEGQETATVLQKGKTGIYKPQVILQRQFSIRQVNFSRPSR